MLFTTISIVLCIVRVLEVDSANLALNKPTYSVSTFGSGWESFNAVDGNLSTCFSSNGANNPWWAVNIGRPVTVMGVILINRGDSWGYRENNFVVGLTNTPPTSNQALDPNSYAMCGQYPGSVADGATVYQPCGVLYPQFQYVIIQTNATGDALNFCEVQVFGYVNLAEGQPTYYVSNWGGGFDSSNAVDGNQCTCMSTRAATNPWWAVDLGNQFPIIGVILFNRADGTFASREDNFIVGLTNTQPTSNQPLALNSYTLCGQYPNTMPVGAIGALPCTPSLQTYRYVIIQENTAQNANANALNMCEVIVLGYANLALNKPTYYVSYFSSSWDSSYAVDGNPATCFSSSYTANPWWAVDLGSQYCIVGVNLTNRLDSSASREDYFIVGLSNTQPTSNQPMNSNNYTLCGTYPSTVPAGATVTQLCPTCTQQYRYVIIQENSTTNTNADGLNFCELQVFGYANKALNQPTFAVSDWPGWDSSLAVDGNPATCFSSGAAINPWWAVDLGSPLSVAGVEMTNRPDSYAYRENHFIVGLTNTQPTTGLSLDPTSYTLCGTYPSTVPAGAVVFQPCTGNLQQFRYVIIQVATSAYGDAINFCELQVFAFGN